MGWETGTGTFIHRNVYIYSLIAMRIWLLYCLNHASVQQCPRKSMRQLHCFAPGEDSQELVVHARDLWLDRWMDKCMPFSCVRQV